MKKRITIFIFTLVTLFTSLMTIQAKEVKLDNISDILSDDVNSAYIIGEYLFTSKHKLTLEDIMLASRSIKSSDEQGRIDTDPIYNEMSIIGISKTYLNDDDMIGHWKYDDNLAGKTTISDDTKLNIKYVDYVYVKDDTRINVDFNVNSYDKYKTALKSKLYFETTDSYLEDVTIDNNGKLQGMIKKNSKVSSAPSIDEKYKNSLYYFAYVLEVPNATNETKVMINGEQLSLDKFDVSVGEDTPGIAILVPVDPKGENTTYEIVVDLDGTKEENDKYNPVTYTFDWSSLKFQSDSKINLTDSILEDAMEGVTFADLLKNDLGFNGNREVEGYTKLSLSCTDNNCELSGDIFTEIAKYNGLSNNDVEGYFFPLVIKTFNYLDEPFNVKGTNMSLTVNGKKIETSEFDTDNAIAILVKLDEKGSKNINIVIDLDGEGNEYTSKTYTISFDSVNFIKTSEFKVTGVQKNDDAYSTLNKNYGWSIEDGQEYKTNFENTENGIRAIDTFIPIYENLNEGVFPGNTTGYYIALRIDLANDETFTKGVSTVKFSNGRVVKDGFDNDNKSLYILKYLDKNIDNSFDIVVDLDGDAKTYADETIHVDLSNIVFQEDSFIQGISIGTSENINENINSKFKEELDGYNYDLSLNNLTLTEEDGNYKLNAGTLRQQPDVNAFKSEEKTGYYIPLLVQVPTRYAHSVTFKLKNNKMGTEFKTIQPKELDGDYLMILFAVYESKDTSMTFEIDLDGEDSNNYRYKEYKIDYSNLTFAKQVKLTYNYGGEVKPVVEVTYVGENLIAPMNPESLRPNHIFDGWYKDGSKFNFEEHPNVEEDLNLTAHWKLNVESYIENLVSAFDEYDDELNIKYSSSNNTITVELINRDSSVEQFTKGILPEAIKDIIKKGEISNIKLKTNDNEVSFDSSVESTVETKLDEFIHKIASDDKLKSLVGKTITVNLGKISESFDETVSYNVDEPKEYKINFTILGMQNVYSEETLNEALKKDDVILLTDSFSVNNTVDINKSNVIIEGNNKTITLTSGKSVFDIKSGHVTIYNLKLSGAEIQVAINVEANAELTFNELDVSSGIEAGIELGSSATLKGTNLKYSGETYDKPAIRILKESSNATVKVDGIKGPIEKEKIITYEDNDGDDKAQGDKKVIDETCNYYNYYLNDNSINKWYKLEYHSDRNITSLASSFIRYYLEGSKTVPTVPDKFDYYTIYKDDYYEYKIDKWCVYPENQICYSYNNIPAPDGDTSYWPKYIKSERTDTAYVNSKQQLDDALAKSEGEDIINTIIVTSDIDYGTEPLKITRPIAIIGKNKDSKNIGSIKGKIIVDSEKVVLDKIKIIGNVDNDENIITVNKPNFTLFQSSILNDSSDKVANSALYFNIGDPSARIYFNDFDGNKIKTFLQFNMNINKDTKIAGNNFYGKAETSNHIEIKDVNDNDVIRISQNTFEFNNLDEYLLKLYPLNNKNVQIEFSNIWFSGSTIYKKAKINMNIVDDSSNFSGYTFNVSSQFNSDFEIHYIKDGLEQENFAVDKKAKIELR